jgi:hypothetical protein
MRAHAWLDHFKPQALRAYGSRRNHTAKAAAQILSCLRKRDLPVRFTVHQLKRPCWSGLTDRATINAALAMLVDHGWLPESEIETGGPSFLIECKGIPIHQKPLFNWQYTDSSLKNIFIHETPLSINAVLFVALPMQLRQSLWHSPKSTSIPASDCKERQDVHGRNGA